MFLNFIFFSLGVLFTECFYMYRLRKEKSTNKKGDMS